MVANALRPCTSGVRCSRKTVLVANKLFRWYWRFGATTKCWRTKFEFTTLRDNERKNIFAKIYNSRLWIRLLVVGTMIVVWMSWLWLYSLAPLALVLCEKWKNTKLFLFGINDSASSWRTTVSQISLLTSSTYKTINATRTHVHSFLRYALIELHNVTFSFDFSTTTTQNCSNELIPRKWEPIRKCTCCYCCYSTHSYLIFRCALLCFMFICSGLKHWLFNIEKEEEKKKKTRQRKMLSSCIWWGQSTRNETFGMLFKWNCRSYQTIGPVLFGTK